MIVCGRPFNVIVRPIADESPPSRSRQNAWLTSTTASLDSRLSEGSIGRPSVGLMRSTSNTHKDKSRATGARLMATLLNALKQHNKRYGLATLCIGGGEAVAAIVERV